MAHIPSGIDLPAWRKRRWGDPPIPPLDESYNVTGGNVQADVATQINQQLYQNALSEEQLEHKKQQMVDSDNRLALAVSLWTGTAPNLVKPSATRKTTSSTKAAADLEKAMLTNEWLKNPPRTKDQVIEFGTAFNASDVGWAYIKNTLAPTFDYGDMVQWKKLMPDGGVKYGYSREFDVQRNELFRGQDYRMGGVEDDRKTQALEAFRTTSALLTGWLAGRKLTQPLLEEFTTSHANILLNPNNIKAVEDIAGVYNLKPIYATFMVTEAHNKKSVNTKFSVRVDSKAYQDELDNPKTIRLSEAKEFEITTTGIREAGKKEIVSTLKTMLEEGNLRNDEDLIIIEAERLLAERAGRDVLFTYDTDKDPQSIFAMLGLAGDREIIEDTIRRSAETKFGEDVGQTALKQHVATLVKDNPNVSDGFAKELNDYIDSMYKREPLRPIIDTEEIVAYPIQMPDGTIESVYAKVEGQRVRVGDATTGAIDVTPTITDPDGVFQILPKLEQVDVNGVPTLKPITGEWIKRYTISNLRKEQEQIGNTVAALIEKPTEYWDAYNTYNQIYAALDEGLETGDNKGWALIDQRIVTLAIKLVDTSMVTESEFESFAKKAGIKDQIKHTLRKWTTGEPLTPGQTRAVLRMTETWLKIKQKQIVDVANEHKKTLERRYPTSKNVILPKGWEIDDLFNVAGASYALMTATPRSSKELIEKYPKFFGVDVEGEKKNGKFDAKTELDTLEKEGGGEPDATTPYVIPTKRKFRGRN